MYVKKLVISNFRGIHKFEAVMNNNMLTIVGKNDVGKSTVLHAMKVFFEEEKIVEDDFPNYNMKKIIEIEITFNTEKFTDLQYNNQLKVKKMYKVVNNRIICNHYVFTLPNLPLQEDLKTYIDYKNVGKAIGIDFPERKPKDERKINELKGEVINKINEKIGKPDWINIDNEWKEFIKYFPDIIFIPASQDHDNEQKMTSDSSVFGKIFRVGIRRWLKVDEKSKDAIKTIEEKVKEINSRILDVVERKLKEQLPLANEISQELSPLDITKGFDFTMLVNDPQGVKTPLSKRGNGLRRSVLIAAIRAQNEVNEMIEKLGEEAAVTKEEAAEYDKPTLYLFEEPEVFLHLAAQRELFYSLKDLTTHNSQIIITSHSTLFVDESEMEEIVLLTRNDGKTTSLQHIPHEDIKDELGEVMRISELITGKACCIVEGVSDKIAFIEWIKKMGYNPSKLGIHFVSMDGCTNAEYYANADILADFRVPFLLILDNDSHKTRDPEIIKRKLEEKYSFLRNKKRIIILKGELENYYDINIVSDVLNIPKKYIDLNKYNEDPKKALDEAKEKAIQNNYKNVRAYNERRDSRKIASKMKEEDIDDDIKQIIKKLIKLVS